MPSVCCTSVLQTEGFSFLVTVKKKLVRRDKENTKMDNFPKMILMFFIMLMIALCNILLSIYIFIVLNDVL